MDWSHLRSLTLISDFSSDGTSCFCGGITGREGVATGMDGALEAVEAAVAPGPADLACGALKFLPAVGLPCGTCI